MNRLEKEGISKEEVTGIGIGVPAPITEEGFVKSTANLGWEEKNVKAEMEERDTEELTAGNYIIRYTSVISNRFDSTTFKRLYADLYKDFTKPVSSRRFTVSC